MEVSKKTLEQIREIYSWMADEKSQKLFIDRLMYSISLDREYIYRLLEDSFIDFSERIKALENRKKIIIYGAGYNCEMVTLACRKYGIKINYVCDKDEKKQGKKYFGYEVISPDMLIHEHRDATVIISTTTYYNEVIHFLQQFFPNKQLISFATKEQIDSVGVQYFDNKVVQVNDGEIFVDGGCFDFETSKILMNMCKVNKIYAFEPDNNNLRKINKELEKIDSSNVQVISSGMWSCDTKLCFKAEGSIQSRIDKDGEEKIDVKALDNVINDKVTFVKMDIEGSELQALIGASKTIKKYKPKLAICIYHKIEDIIEIPQYIHSLVPDYKFYIRHYSFSDSETVLYAI